MLVQVRAAKLTDMPCTSMTMLQAAACSTATHPTVLCGSYDNKVCLLLAFMIMQSHSCTTSAAKTLASPIYELFCVLHESKLNKHALLHQIALSLMTCGVPAGVRNAAWPAAWSL